MSLTQIDSDCKLAREYALLGNYDTAMVYYQGVLQEVLLSTTAGVGSRGRAPEGCEGTGTREYGLLPGGPTRGTTTAQG